MFLGGQMTTEKLMTADEIANVLGISRSKVYKMMRHKEIPTVTIGKNVRVSNVDLESYISKNRIDEKGMN